MDFQELQMSSYCEMGRHILKIVFGSSMSIDKPTIRHHSLTNLDYVLKKMFYIFYNLL